MNLEKESKIVKHDLLETLNKYFPCVQFLLTCVLSYLGCVCKLDRLNTCACLLELSMNRVNSIHVGTTVSDFDSNMLHAGHIQTSLSLWLQYSLSLRV